jgi:hypothetical protein
VSKWEEKSLRFEVLMDLTMTNSSSVLLRLVVQRQNQAGSSTSRLLLLACCLACYSLSPASVV